MSTLDMETLAWPAARLGDALTALLKNAGWKSTVPETANPETFSSGVEAGRWIEWNAKLRGFEAQPVETTLADLEGEFAAAYPALLRVSDSLYVAVVDGGAKFLRVLTPELALKRIPLGQVCNAIREPAIHSARNEIRNLLAETNIAPSRQAKTMHLLLQEQLGQRRFEQVWILRISDGAAPLRWVRQSNAIPHGARLVAAHTVQYLLWLASWAILGRLSLEGRMDRGWLFAWALLLLTLVPFRVLTTWLQGVIAIGVGGILKRRLLAGAMRLTPEEMRQGGIGSFLGQVLEAESLETLALSGAVAGVLATVELAVSAFVLGRFALLLLIWCIVTALLGWAILRRYQRWTRTRMEMTQELVEGMIGHRTRLAQQPREEWHEAEDQALHGYLEVSRAVDRGAAWLIAIIPRGWLIAGLCCLVPAIVSGRTSDTSVALVLGGVLLAWTAFKRLTGSFADISAAWVAWKRVAPLFRAAARPERLGSTFAGQKTVDATGKVLEADRLSFRYRKEGNPALQSCSLIVRRGERILLEGPSGGGKTTFASLLSGMRTPESGLLLVNGLDRHTLGETAWRQQVAAAPQFHENYILTETLAFNLLMGRHWPPTQKDLQEAEAICRELGLDDLLERMPSGMLQMVGEGGWQLSHGERSRIYIARALLQNASMVILDESFAALDPENLRTALECTLSRAKTLMVIAHP